MKLLHIRNQGRYSLARGLAETRSVANIQSVTPPLRVQALNAAPFRASGEWVLYWMMTARRPFFNFALERAVNLAQQLERPLLILEMLQVDPRCSSARTHRFVLDGMADHAAHFSGTPARYYPYVEPKENSAEGLLERLATHAAAIVADEFPDAVISLKARTLAARVGVRVESVDSNGLLPLRAQEKAFARAFDFRRYLWRELPDHLEARPQRDPLRQVQLMACPQLPANITRRWPMASAELLAANSTALAAILVKHRVAEAPLKGGFRAGRQRLTHFIAESLTLYADERNHPDAEVTSHLSPYLHFGHLSAHEILARVLQCEEVSLANLRARSRGIDEPMWRMRPGAEAFLDQLLTWRELGYNFCHLHPEDYDRFDSLPSWAKQTLREHQTDPRSHVYTLEQLESANTADPIWNAAQRELMATGQMHNYLRMLWGKLVIGWTPSPEEAFSYLVELNNKYALDGSDPNSYSGIGWCFGRFDRPWGPKRDCYGSVRFMTSASAQRKLRLKNYLARWSNAR